MGALRSPGERPLCASPPACLQGLPTPCLSPMKSFPPSLFNSRNSTLWRFLAVLALWFSLTGALHAQTSWVQSVRTGEVMRFLFNGSVQSYDLASQAWQPAVALPRSGATALAGDEAGMFVAYGTKIYGYSPAFTDEVSLNAVSNPVRSLFLDGNLLLAAHSSPTEGKVSSFSRTTGARRDTSPASADTLTGASHAPGLNRIFGRTQGVSSPDLSKADYTAAGVVQGPERAYNLGTHPDATLTFVSADGRRVFDNSGNIFSANNLAWLGSLGGKITAMAWKGDAPIVLRGNELIAYNSMLLEEGRMTLPAAGAAVAVQGDYVFVFQANAAQPLARVIPLAQLKAYAPIHAGNGLGLAYTVTDAFLDTFGVVNLVSAEQMSVFRWSPANHLHLPPLALSGYPAATGYAAGSNELYLAYAGKTMRRMDLNAASAPETPFASFTEEIFGVTAADPFIQASYENGFSVLDASAKVLFGEHIGQASSRVNAWDPGRRRMYHFSDRSYPSDLIYDIIGPDGVPTGHGETPYHGDYKIKGPIRLSPDAGRILLGSGDMYFADTLTIAASLPYEIVDGVWKGPYLITIRLIGGLTHVQQWRGALFNEPGILKQVEGEPVRLLNTPYGLLLITSLKGVPRFTLLDDVLNSTYTSPTRPASPGTPTVAMRSDTSITLTWADQSDNEDSFLVNYRAAGTFDPWTFGSVVADSNTAEFRQLSPGVPLEFRVMAESGGLYSAPSAIVRTSTLSVPGEPAGEPYNLTVARVSESRIALTWSDNANNETGFELLRSTNADGLAAVLPVPADTIYFEDTGLTPGTPYFYRIRAVNGAVQGELSSQVNARTATTAAAPAAPSAVTVSAVTATGALITWQDNSANEEEFVVETALAPFAVWTAAATVGYNVRSATLTGLSSSAAYSVRVRAVNSTGSSVSGAKAFATPKLGGDFAGHSMRSGDVYYFAFSGPARIERFSIPTRTWLSPVAMNAPATALWVDSDGIYAVEGRSVLRWNPDGGGRTLLSTAGNDILSVATVEDVLIYFHGFTTVALNKKTGVLLDAPGDRDGGVGVSYYPPLNRLFLLATPGSSINLGMLDIGPDGKYLESFDSPDGSRYPKGTRTFPFPNAGRVADNTGNVYSTDSLEHLGTLGAAFTDLAFRGPDVPIVLRGGKLFAYTNTLLEAGSFDLGSTAGQRVVVDGTDALVFLTDNGNEHGLSLRTVPLDSLRAPVPELPKDPSGLSFTVDDAFMDQNGTVHLLSKAQSSLFRWSATARKWEDTIPLLGSPSRITHAPDLNSVYLNYRSNQLRLMKLVPPFTEEFFAKVIGDQGDMAAMGDLVYTTRRAVFEVLSPLGAVLSNGGDSGGYTATQCVWDPVRRRVYHFRDRSNGTYLLFETFDATGQKTAQGQADYPSLDGSKPIRVSADGTLVATATGPIFRASDMKSVTVLQTSMKDMIWQGNRLLGLEAAGASSSLVQRWDSAWKRAASVSLAGSPERLFPLDGGQVLVITRTEPGRPVFHILDADLNPVYTSLTAPPEILQQPESLRVNFGSTVRLRAGVKSAPGLSYQWYSGSTAIPGAVTPVLTLSNAGSGDAGLYSLVITNGSGTVTTQPARLSVGPLATPFFTPGNLLVSTYKDIQEFTPEGDAGRTLPIAPVPGELYPNALDLAVDSIGRIHVVNSGRVDGVPKYYISTYDSSTGTWSHVATGDLNYVERSRTDLAVSGEWAITYAGLVNVATGESTALPGGFTPSEIIMGLNNNVYGVSGPGSIRRLSLDPLAWSSPVTLSGTATNGVSGLAVAADGKFFSADPYGKIRAHSATGAVLRSLDAPGDSGYVTDLSFSLSGKIAVGFTYSYIALTDSTLASIRRLPVQTGGLPGTFTTWMPAIARPRPAFATPVEIPAATEDTPWAWTPAVTHPDPDAVLTVAAIQLPVWMQFMEGRLSGTPLQRDTGDNTLILSVQCGDETPVEQTFTLPVAEVNDPPAHTDPALNRQEDAAPEEVDLTALFTDEETASGALTYSIIAPPAGVVTTSLTNSSASPLRLAWLPDANGPASVTVRATDAGGLFADAVITINTQSVNDAPTGSLEPLVLDEDATPVEISLDDYFSDVESPDAALAYEAVSSAPALAAAAVVVTGHTLRITPQPDAFGQLEIRVRCLDPEGASVEAAFPLTLVSVNDPPRGSLQSVAVDEDSPPITVDLAAAFSDVESPVSALVFSAVSPLPGTVTAVVAGSVLTLTPQPNANGEVTVSVTGTDPDGDSVTVPLALTIRAVNDPPAIGVALPNVSAGDSAADAVIDFTPFATDPDTGDPLIWSVTGNTNPSIFKTLAFDAQGRLTIQYAPYVSGDAVVTVQVRDAAGTSARSEFLIRLPVLPSPEIQAGAVLTLNRQTGLLEQKVTVRNGAGRPIGGFEITVTGLPVNASVYNSSGRTADGGYVIGYYQPLAAGEEITFILEYYSPARSSLQPVITAATAMPRGAPASEGVGIAIDRALMLESGSFLIEFTAVPGELYEVQYSDTAGTSWSDSFTRIRAAGNRVQWIDRGFPATSSPPQPGKSRFYRVRHLTMP
ncbi:MAG: Immunoglobulin I-set domain protein [Verrucomicrobiales bacterium]|nr:Immunoglobulin I-set domain protein [Verrucomicrobiales bacterium]